MQDTARVASAQVTEPEKARTTERAYRLLELCMLVGGTQWLFAAGLLAERTSVPPVVDVLVGVVGVLVTAAWIVYFRRQSRARLSKFVDPMTGALRLPGERLPLPRRSLAWFVAVPSCEVAFLLLH